MSRYRFVAAEKAAVRNVAKACALLKVSRSAYSQWSQQLPSAHARSESELGERVAAIHGESRGTYGAPRVHQQLRREGVHCARKRVARLMALRGLAGRCRRRFQKTTIPDPLAAVLAPDLVQRSFETAARPLDRVWVGDISYVRTWEGWCYLATVIDLASRRVVGFALADHMRASLICSALEMAIGVRHPAAGLVFHSDRGSQYTSAAFRQLLGRHGIVQSLSRPRQCWDNAVAESFFATLKTEMVYRQPLPTRAAARQAVFEYIEVFYNRQRLHSALGYRSPVEYEASRLAPNAAVPAA
jgi:transposase InsO family protein